MYFSLLLIFSCTSEKEEYMHLFDGVNFRLKDGETVGKTDAKVLQKYNTYFNNLDSAQIPLFKYIRGTTYEIFIGLPLDFDINEILHHKILNIYSLNKKLDPKSDTSIYFLNYYDKQNNNYFEEYLIKPTETSLIYLAAFITLTEHEEFFSGNIELQERLMKKLP